MSRRAGYILNEILAISTVLMITFALVAAVAGERHRLAGIDARMAELDLAQNLLAHLRSGESPPLPTGWRLERARLPGSAIDQVTLTAPDGLHLSTLCRTAP